MTLLWKPALANGAALGRWRELSCKETCICWQLSMPQSPRGERQEGYKTAIGGRSQMPGCGRRPKRKNMTPITHWAWGEPKGRARLPGAVAAQPHARPPLPCSEVVLHTQSSLRLFQHTTLTSATISFSVHQETRLKQLLPHLQRQPQQLQVRSKSPQSAPSEDRLE